ncbi:MAG: Rne/Rng family ribonuclease [Actinomycetaceae bacterium]|nr:Rne/Rng family ribonuclease [Actinomycetaceae bacterium]
MSRKIKTDSPGVDSGQSAIGTMFSEANNSPQQSASREESPKGNTQQQDVANSSKSVLALPAASLLFQAPDTSQVAPQPRSKVSSEQEDRSSEVSPSEKVAAPSSRRQTRASSSRTRTQSAARAGDTAQADTGSEKEPQVEIVVDIDPGDDSPHRRRRRRTRQGADPVEEITSLKGSTRLEAKRQRRKEGRREGRRRTVITEAEFLARRESVKREMIVRERDGLNQIAILEDSLLVEHYVARHTQTTMVGSIFLGRVQNVLPSMEAAFVDVGRGRNAVLYAGEVNWDLLGMEGKPRRIEQALNPGDTVLVQVTKDPIGHKGARLTSQITLAGRHLVLVPSGAMTGISRKLPEAERSRLKRILEEIVPNDYGVIVRTAAEGATEEQLIADVKRLQKIWEDIDTHTKTAKNAPVLLHGEPELALRVVRDVFNEDFTSLQIQGAKAGRSITTYVKEFAEELTDRVSLWKGDDDIFAAHRIDEQLSKGFDRKVWLPSGGSLVIDRTEAMTVVDVNTGKFTGVGGTLEETVTKNNLEAAEEIVRQLRLRDIGGIIVIDFVDMVLESNRDLVLRRLVECLGRDRTRHRVTEVTSLGLVQMTRKRVGQGLVEAFSTQCECCAGRGFIVHDEPVEKDVAPAPQTSKKPVRQRPAKAHADTSSGADMDAVEATKPEVRQTLAAIAKAAAKETPEEPSTPPSNPSKVSKELATPEKRSKEVTVPVTPSAQKPSSSSPVRRRRRAASTGVITTGEGSQDATIVVTTE